MPSTRGFELDGEKLGAAGAGVVEQFGEQTIEPFGFLVKDGDHFVA